MTFEDNEERIFGRGVRRRKKDIDYTEALTEREWLKAIEDGNLEEKQEKKKQRKKRKLDPSYGDEPGAKVRCDNLLLLLHMMEPSSPTPVVFDILDLRKFTQSIC